MESSTCNSGTPWGRQGRQSARPPERRSEWARPGSGGDCRPSRPDSWVDAIVTLLAIVVFGLGWAIVELERADPVQDRYDAAVSVAWSSTGQSGARGEWGEPWTGALQERSRR